MRRVTGSCALRTSRHSRLDSLECSAVEPGMLSQTFYSALARSMLAGEATADAVASRMERTLGRNWRWARNLAKRYLDRFGTKLRPRQKAVVEFLRHDEGLGDAWRRHRGAIRIATWLHEEWEMQPAPVARAWRVPRIESVGALAEWLGVEIGELEWFADLKRLTARSRAGEGDRLNHYDYCMLGKPDGALRLIESPKTRLKVMQRRILAEMLEGIPVHDSVHGFRKGRSIKTFGAPHVGKRVVLKMDLRDFFPSIRGGRVQTLFRMAGYPETVADLLGGICTNATPRGLWKTFGREIGPMRVAEARALYAWPHLPQGAPTSPALANLCAYRMDCRLAALAKAAGAEYTRYADDLAFSGGEELERAVERFIVQVAAIAMEEGFDVHHRKTRVMRRGVRQHLAGLVVNAHANVDRRDFDALKAILTNCVRQGPASQNRGRHPAFREHLQGRVAFVGMVNPARGEKLRRIFERIEW